MKICDSSATTKIVLYTIKVCVVELAISLYTAFSCLSLAHKIFKNKRYYPHKMISTYHYDICPSQAQSYDVLNSTQLVQDQKVMLIVNTKVNYCISVHTN